MTALIISLQKHSASWMARFLSYVELTKPRIAVMVIVAVLVAACVGSHGYMPWDIVWHAVLGTILVAGSASAMNQWIERFRDTKMARTEGRPIPSGRLRASDVLSFGVLLFLVGELYLLTFVNWQTAAWGALTWFLYVAIYTPLKVRSSANTAIGAVAGAMPILMGWSAAERSLDVQGGAIFLILFLWQFPHFMAIAWIYRKQYAAADMKMLTVVDPTGRRAGIQAVLGALAVLITSLVPALVAPSLGARIYGVMAFLLGTGYVLYSIMFFMKRDDLSARRLLRYSLLYLPAILGLLVLIPIL